ncbi:Glycerate kinase [Histomonas meleagridis]|uniref:Glycerate kinase n=1 Tax=Histomonas meleagridis TaxID=135588 RepID=UPI00355AB86B|nr:Glycerate kinase [Histomonas meleagridis]KAH0801295.1 Glycerate kinase [Histomonas meleagridis]
MKGSLSARAASKAIASGASEAINFYTKNFGKKINFDLICQPIADGGDDTLDVLAEEKYQTNVTGPLLQNVTAQWGSRGKTAIIEMAKASGIALLDPKDLNPFKATTYGTGQLIEAAVKKGFKDILITIGGSATCDGGIGALAALGAKFYDSHGNKFIPYGNISTGKVASIDLGNAQSLLKGVKISIACDVDNPLLGNHGSIYTFGKQKLCPSIQNNQQKLKQALSDMEKNIAKYSHLITKTTNKNVENLPGCGAAGGFPLSFCPIFDAKLERGSSLVLKILEFDKYKGSDLVFTCEGQCDEQTLHGKGPYAVVKKLEGSHIVFLCGGIESEEVEKKMLSEGASIVASITDRPETLQECIEATPELLRRAAFRHTYSYLVSKL